MASHATPEPTLADVFSLLQRCASKDDINEIKTHITAYQRKTDEKIDNIKQQVIYVTATNEQNANKIEELQASVETLKQDQLRNNICVSGIPLQLISNDNTAELIINIAAKLDVKIAKNHFTSYAIANKKFVIVKFFNYKHKQQLLLRIRTKKSLMVEEVFKVKSNSQLYLNDHMTPYFNHLYLLARNAKKEGKLASATSYGGKIRTRKNLNDVPITITSEKQLQTLIEMDPSNDSSDSLQQSDNSIIELNHTQEERNTSSSTSTSTSTSTPKASKKDNNKGKKEKERKNPITKSITTDRVRNKRKADQPPSGPPKKSKEQRSQ